MTSKLEKFKLPIKPVFILCGVLVAACSNEVGSNAAQTGELNVASRKASKLQTTKLQTAKLQAADMTEAQAAISKLEFLVGDWEGPGTSYGADGAKTLYRDTEFVRFDLDRHLLLINARGERPDGTTSYSLHTVIHYNVKTQTYIYTPYSGKRQPSSFDCKLNDKPQLLCFTQDKTYRLTFQRLADGRWNEFGERLNGDQWTKNFETILSAR